MMARRMRMAAAWLALMVAALPALGGEADVLSATARRGSDGTWRFDVTVKHADAGWDHYADAFEILAPDGELLARRVLAHPHEQEQPFTRSVSGVAIPPGLKRVRIRAHDKVHGHGGRELMLELPGR